MGTKNHEKTLTSCSHGPIHCRPCDNVTGCDVCSGCAYCTHGGKRKIAVGVIIKARTDGARYVVPKEVVAESQRARSADDLLALLGVYCAANAMAPILECEIAYPSTKRAPMVKVEMTWREGAELRRIVTHLNGTIRDALANILSRLIDTGGVA